MARNRQPNRKPAKSGNVILILAFMTTLVTVGIIFSVTMAPNDGSLKSVMMEAPKSLSQKILEWLPQGLSSHHSPEELFLYPDYSQEFWSPIDVDVTSDPMITMCKLNFKQYSETPHLYPMFRDLEGISGCRGQNKRRALLSVLMKEITDKKGTPEGNVITPTAFIFHESRVGSTLVANTLASDPFSMVYSESAPAANAILHCRTCTLERNVQIFRDVITLMGRSPVHKRVFFKFQSITSTKMHIALLAFPNTPWAFIYRQPVQTMMSHLDPLKGTAGAPCLRSMRDPPLEVKQALFAVGATDIKDKEAWCAAHLNMLCTSALKAYEEYGLYNDSTQRGFLVNYESLPGSVARLLLPSFGVDPSEHWLSKMAVESKSYSKSRGKPKAFLGDSEDKDQRATALIQKYSNSILQPTYEKMLSVSTNNLKKVSLELYNTIMIKRNKNDVSKVDGVNIDTINWKSLKDIPVTATHSVPVSQKGKQIEFMDNTNIEDIDLTNHLRGQHSKSNKIKEYLSWAPFSNSHKSKPYETTECPSKPLPGYPKAYNMINVLDNWNADNTEIPAFHYDSLCHFDYQNVTDLEKAMAYRTAEVPFIAYNIPELDAVAKKWNSLDYLEKRLGKKTYRTETSKDNHFMYWHAGLPFKLPNGEKWKPPTGLVQITFEEWLETAVKGQNKTLDNRTHQYFRVSSDMNNNWLFDELPFFKPKKSLMMVEPQEQRGIHCRFGMRNIIAEAHFDGSRNSVVMIGGLRRWILSHPDQCENMHMLPRQHPSGRHSAVDW
eukprot:CAMPEP_0119045380 /NCGR_PEP_ID=MMETSP1177-20130426/39290_1 /TAXON_ID=2985 /ORGANISM="Ochromonas sp, Strain CCMP1899" /LENGTH=776 /DNA_ID=CAMNT_0007017035 /DNA_START=164 /DNA_END=2491 /DNA_ORIENTATION=+